MFKLVDVSPEDILKMKRVATFIYPQTDKDYPLRIYTHYSRGPLVLPALSGDEPAEKQRK